MALGLYREIPPGIRGFQGRGPLWGISWRLWLSDGPARSDLEHPMSWRPEQISCLPRSTNNDISSLIDGQKVKSSEYFIECEIGDLHKHIRLSRYLSTVAVNCPASPNKSKLPSPSPRIEPNFMLTPSPTQADCCPEIPLQDGGPLGV